jgi:hypothetical protein
MMNSMRRQIVEDIAEKIFYESNGDLEFSEKISQRNDLSLVEKIYAGCLVRRFLS